MNEKELIRRALMGDKQAQGLCTAKGIMLPCPFCGGKAALVEEAGLYSICCKDGTCIGSDIRPEYGELIYAIADWNTRPAPPIGRCGECKCWQRNGSDWGSCSEWYTEDNEQAFMLESDFCSSFEPREE